MRRRNKNNRVSIDEISTREPNKFKNLNRSKICKTPLCSRLNRIDVPEPYNIKIIDLNNSLMSEPINQQIN